MNPLTLQRLNDQVFRVLSRQGEQVGNLKRIGGVWKFKAIGHDASGNVIPAVAPTPSGTTWFLRLPMRPWSAPA